MIADSAERLFDRFTGLNWPQMLERYARSILMVPPLILGGIATMAAFAVIVKLVARASA